MSTWLAEFYYATTIFMLTAYWTALFHVYFYADFACWIVLCDCCFYIDGLPNSIMWCLLLCWLHLQNCIMWLLCLCWIYSQNSSMTIVFNTDFAYRTLSALRVMGKIRRRRWTSRRCLMRKFRKMSALFTTSKNLSLKLPVHPR